LLDAIWLQFGQDITSKTKLRFCIQCSKPLEAGKRADAKFCSVNVGSTTAGAHHNETSWHYQIPFAGFLLD
jgi:hypothetical protein